MQKTIEQLDKIFITDLLIRCIIGTNDWERTQKQDVILNITLYADLETASKTDRLEHTVDYKQIKQNLISTVEASSFFLVERLAGQIAEVCLANPMVKRVCVRLEKPAALRFAKSVGIELTRDQ